MNSGSLAFLSRLRRVGVLSPNISAKNSLIQRLKFQATAAIKTLITSPITPFKKFLTNRKSDFR